MVVVLVAVDVHPVTGAERLHHRQELKMLISLNHVQATG